jgi:hypothetical protein
VTTVVQAHTQDFDNKTKVDSDHVEEEEHVEESVIAGRDEFVAVLVPFRRPLQMLGTKPPVVLMPDS